MKLLFVDFFLLRVEVVVFENLVVLLLMNMVVLVASILFLVVAFVYR
jgi:hypothetical protein